MNKIITLFVFSIFVLFDISCKQSTNYKCTKKYNLEIKQYTDSLLNIKTTDEEFIKDIMDFERSIGSTILYCRNSEDTSLFNQYKDSLLNPEDKYEDGRDKNSCVSCFFGENSKTIVVAIRPQKHSFIKELAVYALNFDNIYKTYYYYRNHTLDKLLPQNILVQYQKDSFNINEFWCYREQLLDVLDKYHGVDSPITRSYNADSKPKGNKERYLEDRSYDYIDQMNKENFTGTNEDYKWLYDNRKKMRYISWITAMYQPYENKLYTGTFWYNTDLYTKDEGVYYNAGSISSPKDIYIELDLTYRKEFVDQIIYK